eukprot:GEMP01008925.1.p1 GENE.GEMP01008925.1~~GEMP01008925.1.p1  ORF type:complete len:727 (+),score=174.74 GEMP01008925.1:144-2324(+)
MPDKWKNLKTIAEDAEERGHRRKWSRRLTGRRTVCGQVEEEEQCDPEQIDPRKRGSLPKFERTQSHEIQGTNLRGERILQRGYDTFYEKIMGHRGDSKVFDTCRTFCKDLLCTVVYGDPGSKDVEEELMRKLMQVASISVSDAYSMTHDAIDNYLSLKHKYTDLLARHRNAARNHMAELIVLRHKVGRQDVDMSDIEVSDVTFYDALKMQDDENRELCTSVINERLRELFEAPNQFMRDFIHKLYPSGSGPDWMEGTIGVTPEELQEAKDDKAFLENQLKIAKSRIVQLEGDLKDAILAANESREEGAAKKKAMKLVEDEVHEEQELLEPLGLVIPPELLDRVEQLTEECARLQAAIDAQDALLDEKDLIIADLEGQLATARTEAGVASKGRSEPAVVEVLDRSDEVTELTKTLESTTSQLEAELALHATTRQELKKMRNQFSASAQEVRNLEEQYATVCSDLQDEKAKQEKMMQQMRTLQNAVSQLQLKLKVLDTRAGRESDLDVDLVDLGFGADKPWMSVFERLFQDAVDKIRRLEKLREISRREMMKDLLEVINSFWKTCPLEEESKKPPLAPSFAISSGMTSFLVVTKKIRPERTPKSARKYGGKLKKSNEDTAEPGAIFDLLGDAVPQQRTRRSASMPKLHPSESAPYRQLRRSQMMTNVPSASYKLDAMDIVSRESWGEKCRRKRHEMVHSHSTQCPDCSGLVPSLGLGWCMPKPTSENA